MQVLKNRGQPAVIFNVIHPKYNAVVGITERLRQDPKCYPRTPQHQQGADLATAVLRYALDSNDWKGKHPRIARFGAVDAIGGVEYDLEQGDRGDPEVRMHIVYPDTFFYDPRSFDEGFTDARFMGVSKWADPEQVKEIFPDKAEEIDNLMEGGGSDLTQDSDRELLWANSTQKRVRLVDHWYIQQGRVALVRLYRQFHHGSGQVALHRRARQELFQVSHVLGLDRPRRRPLRLSPAMERPAGRIQYAALQGAASAQLAPHSLHQGHGR